VQDAQSYENPPPQQLIEATLLAVDQVGMGDASIALIARLAGVSNGISVNYFQDKNGLIRRHDAVSDERPQRDVTRAAWRWKHNRPRAHLQVIIEATSTPAKSNGPAMKTWLAFWATSMHHPSLHRLQRINRSPSVFQPVLPVPRVLSLTMHAAQHAAGSPDRRFVVARALSETAIDTGRRNRSLTIHGFPTG